VSRIDIGPGLLDKLARSRELTGATSVHILIDANVARYHRVGVLAKLPASADRLVLPPGESNKSMRKAPQIIEWLHDGGADRKSLLIAVGGGVVTDLAGFAASTYMRGINYLSIPTTLVSQLDAAIGGKTAINLGGTKNIAGTFYPPQRIVCAPEVLTTLKPNLIRDGLVEAIKIFAARDRRLFAKHTAKLRGYLDGEDLQGLIADAVRLKVEIVNRDPFERDLRRVLNLGHTAGHAYEAITHHSHGKSVAFGMLVALELSLALASLKQSEFELVRSAVLDLYRRFSLDAISAESLWLRIQHDKKKSGKDINFVLLKRCGEHAVKSVNYRQFQFALAATLERLES
jgi:3-dehydroquinate synthase